MTWYNQYGVEMFFRTVDGEIITTYGSESPAGGGDTVYDYYVNGVHKTSTVEPTPYPVEVSDDSYRQRELMGMNMLTLRVESEVQIPFPVGCYVLVGGERYTLKRRANFVRKHSRSIEYTLLMYGDDDRTHSCAFRHTIGVYTDGVMTADNGDGRLSFTLTATPQTHLQMVIDNLNRGMAAGDTPWTIGSCITGVEKLVSYDFIYVADALEQLAETFETEYYFNGRAISLGKLELAKSNPLALSYGEGNGLKPNSGCAVEGDNPPLERVFIQGGEQNIDPSVYGKTVTTNNGVTTYTGEGSRTLLLPKNGQIYYNGTNFYAPGASGIPSDARRYVVSADRRSITRYGNSNPQMDGFYDATEIYPKRVGTITGVVTVDAENHLYDIVDSNIPSSLNYSDCLIAGETMTIIFQSGILAGREFDVKYYHNAVGSKAARRFEIVPTEQDGEIMPNATFIPAVGDTYAVFHCQLPDAYFDAYSGGTRLYEGAEWDAMREIVKYLYDHEEETFTLSGAEIDSKWAKNNWETVGDYMNLGYHVLYTDSNLPEGLKLRVTSVKDYINNPYNVQLTLTNAIVETTLGSTIKRRRRIFPWGTEPVVLERERDIWNQAYRALSDKVSDGTFKAERNTIHNKIGEYRTSIQGIQTLFQTIQTRYNTLRNALVDENGKVNGVVIEGIGTGQCSVVPGDSFHPSHEQCSYSDITIDIPTELQN